MYLIKLFDAECGDMDSVECAESFDDATAWLVEHLGPSDRYVVRAQCGESHIGKPDKLAVLEVELDDVVIARIEDSRPVSPLATDACVDACNALFDGDNSGLTRLFTGANR